LSIILHIIDDIDGRVAALAHFAPSSINCRFGSYGNFGGVPGGCKRIVVREVRMIGESVNW